jgi:hypothetical protein
MTYMTLGLTPVSSNFVRVSLSQVLQKFFPMENAVYYLPIVIGLGGIIWFYFSKPKPAVKPTPTVVQNKPKVSPATPVKRAQKKKEGSVRLNEAQVSFLLILACDHLLIFVVRWTAGEDILWIANRNSRRFFA